MRAREKLAWLLLSALAIAGVVVACHDPSAAGAARPAGFQMSACPVPPGYASGTPAACIIMTGAGDGDHGLDVYAGQDSTKAVCVYDAHNNPSSCLTTLGGSVETFGRTAAGTWDGDSLTSFGHPGGGKGNVFVPTNRVLANGGIITGGAVTLCPPGHLVDLKGCAKLTIRDIQWIHAHGG